MLQQVNSNKDIYITNDINIFTKILLLLHYRFIYIFSMGLKLTLSIQSIKTKKKRAKIT